MEQGPEITFIVHPRPALEDEGGTADPAPLPAHLEPAPAMTGPDGDDHGDTFLGNLAFLVRFAFGRY